MVRPVSATSGWVYRHVIKRVLFTQSPDAVHTGLLRFSRIRQRLAFSNHLVRLLLSYRNDDMLSQTIDGIRFINPVGLSAGFDKDVELVPTMKAVGFGFMTGGSVTLNACSGNPRPWFYRLPKSKSLVVHAGLPNEGADAVRARLSAYPATEFHDFPLIVSVAKTNSPETCSDDEATQDYLGTLRKLRDEPNVSVFEINISCPNTYGGEPFTTPKRLETLLSEIDALRLVQPVWIKMPVSIPWLEFSALLAVIVKHRVSAVTIANLHKDRSSAELYDKLPDSIPGNLSGLPTQAPSDELIARTYRVYGDRLRIIGVGGVFSAEDAYRKITLGATMVELITGMIFEGPQLIGQINLGLTRLLHRDGFTHIQQAVGASHQRRYQSENHPHKK